MPESADLFWVSNNVKVGWIGEVLRLPLAEALIPIVDRALTDGAQEERDGVLREAVRMPQPSLALGYSGPYIEGWNAALAQLSRRVEAGEHRKP